ncbi:MAG: tyrosine--tRNA ligase [Sulfolobales archaeon]
MDIETKLMKIREGTEEIITEEELKMLLETGGGKGYLGFEPSGVFHIGWIVWALKFKDLIEAGFKMKLLSATWHAWINDKFGGDMDLIRKASDHIIEVLDLLGVKRGSYELVYAEDLVSDKDYWALLLRAAKYTTLARAKRALTIMGRRAEEAETDFSKLIYPFMQVTDIFYMDLDLALGGIDQRKAHMLTRELADKLKKKKIVAIHTPLIPSLKGPEAGRMETSVSLEIDEKYSSSKMSKSKPETAIFVIDSPEEIRSKIHKAYCPPKIVEENPIISIAENIILRIKRSMKIERPLRYGGDITISNREELRKIYSEGSLHPLDLKENVARELIDILTPVREELIKRGSIDIAKYLMSKVSRSLEK